MATNYSITDLTHDGSPATDNWLIEVNVADTTTPPAGPDGSNQKITISQVLSLVPEATTTSYGTIKGNGSTTEYLNGDLQWATPAGGGGGTAGVTGWKNFIADYGADPTGGSSSSTALANACTAAVNAQPASFGLMIPPGEYLVTEPQQLPYNMVFQGSGVNNNITGHLIGSWFNVSSAFSGTYVLGLSDTSGHASINGAVCSNFGINGSNYSSAAVNGLLLTGPVMCILENIVISDMSGWGISTAQDDSASEIGPYGQTWNNIIVADCGVVSGGGINLVYCEDSVFTELYSIGNGSGPGILIEGCDNAKFTACNAEWNATYGYYITGDWSYFVGGCELTGCTSDANMKSGYYQDATWTTGLGGGTGPGLLEVTGCHFRRDGSNYNATVTTVDSAGITLASTTLPVMFTGFSTYPDTPDGQTSPYNPEYGIYLPETSYTAPIIFSGGIAWGVTNAIKTASGTAMPANSTIFQSSAIITVNGQSNTPSY